MFVATTQRNDLCLAPGGSSPLASLCASPHQRKAGVEAVDL